MSALIRPCKFFEPRYFSAHIAADKPQVQAELGERETPWLNKSALKDWIGKLPKMISRATEWCPPAQKALGGVYRRWVGVGSQLPDWLLEQWLEIAEIEPTLPREYEILDLAETFDSGPADVVDAYVKLCDKLGCCYPEVAGVQFTHVYLAPRLKRGGSDLVTLNYILLTASNPANRVLIIVTDELESPWKTRLPKSVALLNFYEVALHLDRYTRQKLLANLLVQLQPDVIHNIYSRLGNQVYVAYGRALANLSRLFAPAFCVEVEPDGKPVGEIISYLPEHAIHLTGILSDNKYIFSYLEEVFGLDPEKMHVHYQPVRMKALPSPQIQTSSSDLNVLWAGRLDRQKRPDLLLEIARLCEHDGIHFHIWGSNVVVRDKAKVDFDTHPNVTYHGEFDGLVSLPTRDYDVFLNTSQWDGMPNILLEAVAVGLPIVTSNVGGIPELIISDQTGILVTPFDDVEQYAASLRRLKADRQLCERLIETSRKLLAKRHSWEHFSEELNRLPGYFKNPALLERAELSLLENPSEAKSPKTKEFD